MADMYSEIRPDLRWIADWLEDDHLQYKSYNNGIQFNVTDENGIIHSYYPTTGTALFHKSNERGGGSKTLRNQTLEQFLYYIRNPILIRNLFSKKGDVSK